VGAALGRARSNGRNRSLSANAGFFIDKKDSFGIMKRTVISLLIATAVLILNNHSATGGNFMKEKEVAMEIKITSTAFADGELIPRKHACDGPDVSPALAWDAGPPGTQSFALVCDDPDAPRGTWVHWVIFNIPGTIHELAEGIPPDRKIGGIGAEQGRNDFGRIGYNGPCPPSGMHRYFFKIYALDKLLALPTVATKAQLIKASEGHVLAQGQLIGKYRR
jgi:Raf kinase inhibitor-like YbhB/YbcL family protein